MRILKFGNDYANQRSLKVNEMANVDDTNAASAQCEESKEAESAEVGHDTSKGPGRKKKEKTAQES